MKFKRYRSFLLTVIATAVLMGCQNPDKELNAQTTAEESAADVTVVMTEYSDFQCPACAYFFPIVEKLKQHYGDQLEVNYRHFPLNMHQYAMLAARAAEAARNQGKFEEMHDMLFKNQRSWAGSGNPQPMFINYAKKLGLDITQFKSDLNSAETQRAVIEQKKAGEERGVNSTPTFYINGEEIVSLPRNYEQFKALLDIYMKEAEQAAQSKK